MLKLKVHDLCYELYGQSEEQCDDLFWMNIKTLCPPNGIFGVKMCRTGADMAWETLQDWGHVAYSDYWKKQTPAPVKCEKNCKCGPDKFVATFDWTTYPYTLYNVILRIASNFLETREWPTQKK